MWSLLCEATIIKRKIVFSPPILSRKPLNSRRQIFKVCPTWRGRDSMFIWHESVEEFLRGRDGSKVVVVWGQYKATDGFSKTVEMLHKKHFGGLFNTVRKKFDVDLTENSRGFFQRKDSKLILCGRIISWNYQTQFKGDISPVVFYVHSWSV
jgi:hypothetical protein